MSGTKRSLSMVSFIWRFHGSIGKTVLHFSRELVFYLEVRSVSGSPLYIDTRFILLPHPCGVEPILGGRYLGGGGGGGG